MFFQVLNVLSWRKLRHGQGAGFVEDSISALWLLEVQVYGLVVLISGLIV
jgi:hypothetical protein